MANNIKSHSALMKTLSKMGESEPVKDKKEPAQDPEFVDKEWRRLMAFQRGMR